MLNQGFYDAVLHRHSVRNYSPVPVPEDALHRIMEAARLAPSGGNSQAHRFVVVRNAETIDKLAAAAGNQTWVRSAPVVIACCAIPELPVGDGDDFAREVNIRRWGLSAVEWMETMDHKELLALLVGNGGPMIAGEHIALAASAEGLGTCWIGYLDIQEASRILAIPEGWRCYFLLTLGYPAQPISPGGHSRIPLTDMVFAEKWGEVWNKAEELSPF